MAALVIGLAGRIPRLLSDMSVLGQYSAGRIE